jgi:eukaryotic-like serine/threonine-protein kinase
VSTVGRFEIEREAASGGAGTVYRARDPDSGRPVAVKVIRGVHPADLERFSREARTLAQIRHPGVVRSIEHGTTDAGDPYLVMEWLDGEDLRDRLARTGLTIAESVTLARRVAEALAAVHERGLIHRDIKPGNLFLPAGVVSDVKIIDFGLARGDGSLGPTQTGVVVGTPSYMAPEQARGQRDIDARADLYALGCVLFKCLTGRVPFPGKDLMAVLAKVLLDDAPRVGESCPRVPVLLEDLVARLLAKDPAARPRSAVAVAEALAAVAPFVAASAAGDDDPKPGPISQPPSGLMLGERRIVAMLLVGPGDDERTVQTGDELSRASGDAVLRVVQEHGGQLDRLMDGTRVVAFTNPSVATDQASRAARCALAIRASLPGAPMVLATSRSEMSERLPVGDAVDRAAQMRGRRVRSRAGGPAAIAIDEVTAALLDRRFEVTSTDEGPELHGYRELPAGARTVLGRETPFIGREWELASIEDLFQGSVDEPLAQAVLVTCPPGMGKTRLGQEVVRALQRRHPGLALWSGRGDPLRAASSLKLLGQVVRSALGVDEGAAPDEQQRQIQRRAALHIPSRAAARAACFLGEIASVPFDGEGHPELRAARGDPRLMGEQMRAAWEELLEAECGAHPVLVLIEDLQWADAPTVRFLDDALRHRSRLPWMVLALARPEVHDVYLDLWKGRNLQEIRIKPLARRASERLLHEVLGDGVGAETLTRLAARADGNPFYLEELSRAVAERGHAAEEALPETVLAMVQSRLATLAPGARRALRAASVLGEVFWPAGVAALLGAGSGPAPEDGWIEQLLREEVLVRCRDRRFAGEEALGFRHALLREGAYAMLTERDRVIGHRLAGEWLEQNGEADPMLLARHFELGEEPAKAGGYHVRAARQALRSADFTAARAHLERALAGGIAGDLRNECLGLLCQTHTWRGEWEASATYAAEVTRLAAPGSEPWVMGLLAMQTAAFNLGKLQKFMEALRLLMGVDPPPEVAGAVLRSLGVGVALACFAARFEVVPGILARIAALSASSAARDPVALGWMHMAEGCWKAWGIGDVWAGLRQMEAARHCFDTANDDRHVQLSQVLAARMEWNLGMFDEAELELRGPLTGDDHVITQQRVFYRALVQIDRGALGEAGELAARRIELARQSPQGVDVIREAEGRWLHGEIALRSGDLAGAEREIEAALGPLSTSPLFWRLAAAALVEVRCRQGRAAEAVALAREILVTVEAQGGAGQRAGRLQLAYAESLYASGDAEAGDAVLARARRDLLERAGWIDDPEVRRRFLTGIPEHACTLALASQKLGPPSDA